MPLALLITDLIDSLIRVHFSKSRAVECPIMLARHTPFKLKIIKIIVSFVTRIYLTDRDNLITLIGQFFSSIRKTRGRGLLRCFDYVVVFICYYTT